MDSEAIKQLFDLMINFASKFSIGNIELLSSLKAKFGIARNDQTTKSIGL